VLDTNGSFPFDLWSESRFCQIDTFCFSIDGHIDSIHDKIRGKGSFANLLKQIQYAKDRKHKVKFTHTITNENIEYIIDMIRFANDLGVDEFNVHVATFNGRAKYIDDPNIISPNTWYRTYEYVRDYVQKATLNDNFSLRIPPRYCTYDELAYKYCDHLCISHIKDRVLILPEDKAKGDKGGPLYLCGLLIGERKKLGSNIQGNFVFNINDDAEAKYYNDIPYTNGTQLCPIVFHDDENLNYLKDNNLFPLCISYKPNLRIVAQNERSR
jgi:MoaA/NifB/PqqE/SkfB family radical SAM enzyme